MHTAQRAPVLLALQQTHGNRYVQRVVAGIQAKLVVGQPGDIYEQEADRVADVVMRMPEPQVQRQPEEEEKKKKEKRLLQAKPLAEQITPLVQRQPIEEEEVTPNLESRINAIRGGGQPLPASTRAFFETRFGYDFSPVRVHNDTEADTLNHALNAHSFTTGQDVFFRQSEYNPGSLSSGRKLLAHELTHVVQQMGGNNNTGLSHWSPVLQRGSLDELVEEATGGQVELQALRASAELPEGMLLSGDWSYELRTSSTTTVRASVDHNGIRISFSPWLFIDAQYPVPNVEVRSVSYDFATASTSVNAESEGFRIVDLIPAGWVGRLIDPVEIIQETISSLINQALQGTPAGNPGYDIFADPELTTRTLNNIIRNFESLPRSGETEASLSDVADISAGVSISLQNDFEYMSPDGGLRVQHGEVLNIDVEGQGTAQQIQHGVQQSLQAAVEAASIRAIRICGNVLVVRDEEPLVNLTRIRIEPGPRVQIEDLELLGEALEYAHGEQVLVFLFHLFDYASRGVPPEIAARLAAIRDPEAVIVPGITREVIESALTDGVAQLLREHATAIPGIDLRPILGE
jgi:hypothetical protein